MNTTLVEIFIASAAIAFVLTLVDKKTVNTEILRECKRRMEDYRKKADEARKNNKVADMQRYQQMMMSTMNQQMGMQNKSLIYKMVVIIPFFLVMGYVFGSPSLHLEGTDSLTGVWKISGIEKPAVYTHSRFTIDGIDVVDKKISIGGKDYKVDVGNPVKRATEGGEITTREIKMTEIVVKMPFTIPYFGDRFGWVGWYFLSSMPLSMLFRKIYGLSF
ncbi:MAG: DUF106 domain-containing protein [Candidatus Aenigmarchaeota archaeon]|nr:DUF106 domain-containing protein [Candidatus Aenigmarchaeota archaeon]